MIYIVNRLYKVDVHGGRSRQLGANAIKLEHLPPTRQETIIITKRMLRMVDSELVFDVDESLDIAQKLPRCGCSTNCRSARCSCHNSLTLCSVLCGCRDRNCIHNQNMAFNVEGFQVADDDFFEE